MNGRLGSNTVKVTEIYQQITTYIEEYMSGGAFLAKIRSSTI